ncbi:MAG: long-chain fatty acid--CoA ligase [Candidatus Eremiobacteraeota bacterium]|nr:long-chain fatty acid--CoA ligase [Candidatus Eremiobacteraeota bacterium]
MRGLMMDVPLMISSILKHGARFHHDVEIVSRSVEGPIHRYTYADLAKRSAQLAHALVGLGVREGDRVGTLAWNTYRHVELYYGIAGIGAICHTINPRLHADQIAYIVEHARDEILFVDLTFVPLLESLQDRLPRVRTYVIMTAEATMPQTTLRHVLCYETLLAERPQNYAWPAFDENTASGLCYTSGTTGSPKGALYSHRSTVLHAMTGCMAEMSWMPESRISVMPIVPMFHVNAWGFPFAAPMMGAKLVLPGPLHDAPSLYELLEGEGVRRAGAVPTVWLALLDYLERTGRELTALRSMRVGGSSAPASMVRAFEARGIEVTNGWGMTEMSPVGTTGTVKAKHLESPERSRYQSTQGRCLYNVDMRVVDDDGGILPDDGVSQGELQVRGPWVASAYYEDAEATAKAFTPDGWFKTGDIVSIDVDGYMSLRDRSKDLIKSGGEWISSIDLENAAVAHPEIAEAAAIGVPHPKWSERPVLCVVRQPGSTLDRDAVLAFLDGKIAKWWMPDDVAFVDTLPHTATGKVSKRDLRAQYAGKDVL